MFHKKVTTDKQENKENRRFTDNMRAGATVLGPQAKVTGNIGGNEDIHVYGNIKGNVELRASLVVCAGGKITGDVQAANVVIDGEIKGDVEAADKIELRDGAKVTGNLAAVAIAISEGAFFQGNVKMGASSKDDKPTSFKEKRGQESTESPSK